MAHLKPINLLDAIDTSTPITSEYVVVDCDANIRKAGSWNIAEEGGFLEHIYDGFYKVKRIVAENLSLIIMSEWPMKM